MGEAIETTGGCQCGAFRYRVRLAAPEGYWCHCRMCQRAVGNVAAAFVNAAKADVAWLAGPPPTYMSSAIGRRGFCDRCGTPLTFDYPDSGRIDLTLGSLDAPEAIRPISHFGVETRHFDWIVADALPATRCDEHQPLRDRWAGATGAPE